MNENGDCVACEEGCSDCSTGKCTLCIEGMTCDLSCGDGTPFYDYIYGMCAPDCGDYGVALNYSYAGLKTPYCAYCDDNCNECDVVK